MNIQITSDRKREWNERKINGSKVYVESNANEVIDSFFSQKNIQSLDYPSKVWRSLKREAQKLIIPGIIKTICVIKEAKVVYSHKCGCGCGCSPGYNASDVAPEFENASVWLNITFSEEEQHFITYFLEGNYGPEKKKFAEETGLKGVAYVRVQRFSTLYIFDLITKEIDIVEI